MRSIVLVLAAAVLLTAACDAPTDPCADPDAWEWTPLLAGADTVMLMGVCMAKTG